MRRGGSAHIAQLLCTTSHTRLYCICRAHIIQNTPKCAANTSFCCAGTIFICKWHATKHQHHRVHVFYYIVRIHHRTIEWQINWIAKNLYRVFWYGKWKHWNRFYIHTFIYIGIYEIYSFVYVYCQYQSSPGKIN